jgi:hypothetical protein
LSAVLSEHGFVRLFNPCKGCCSLRLSDYLTSDIAGHDVMLATPPQYFAESLQHYLQSKGQSSKATSLCALVNTNHALFPKWKSFLQDMKRVSCPGVPGYAFWVNEPTIPEAANVQLDGASNSSCTMVFNGSANGQSAYFLLDSGASHCFIDQSFAEQYGFARHPTRTSVQLANGTAANTTMKCNLRIKIQRHISKVPCFVLDMQQQYDVIL